jgi:hypothetical protein
MCFSDWSSVSVGEEVYYGTRESRSPTDCTDTRECRCHNWTCETRAVENFTWYRTIIGTIPTEGPRSTSWQSAHICFQMIVLYGCNFANDYINTLRISSCYITFCGQRKHVFRLRVWSTSTTVACGHGIIFMLSANLVIKSASFTAFGLESSRTLSWAQCSTISWFSGNHSTGDA